MNVKKTDKSSAFENSEVINKRVLMIAPLQGRMTGQRNISLRVEEHLKEQIYKSIDTNYEDKSLFIKVMRFLSSIPVIVLGRKKFDVVYLSTKRSLSGILIDSLYIFLLTTLGKGVMVHVHGSEFSENFARFHPLVRKVVASVFDRIRKVILLYPGLAIQYPFNVEKVVVENYVPNFSHYQHIDIRAKQSKIFYLSLILKEKGILNLIAAFEIFADSNSIYTLEIAGAQLASSPDVQKIIEVSRHRARINFHGFITEEQKILFFKTSKIFCLPTFYKTEAQPTSIMEAVCASCICIGGSVGSIPDILAKSSSSLLVDGADIKDIVRALFEASEKQIQLRSPKIDFLGEDEWCQRIADVILN